MAEWRLSGRAGGWTRAGEGITDCQALEDVLKVADVCEQLGVVLLDAGFVQAGEVNCSPHIHPRPLLLGTFLRLHMSPQHF